jgi:hypothetical protein
MTGATMDLLPAICVDPEGLDTWAQMINSIQGYNVTLALTNGTTGEGAISHLNWGALQVTLTLTDVNEEWTPQEGSFSSYPLEEITGIVVH